MNNKTKIVITLIIFFSFILIFNVSKLYIGLSNIKKEIGSKHNNLSNTEIKVPIITNTDNEIIPEKENIITNTDNKIEVPIKPNNNPKINYNNISVTYNTFTNKGFLLKLKIETDIKPTLLINEKQYELTKLNNYNYEVNVDILDLPNGNYELYIKTNKNYPLINKLDLLEKINRAKINNKLVTFDYTNNTTFKIENFNYEYDILIDPGHGGIDSGTVNKTTTEAKINLMQSLYEKERYEAHGLKVQLSRNDDSSGMMMGDNSWNRAKLRGYAIGYYGVLAKIIYSNHQNSGTNPKTNGFEILVSARLNSEELKPEIEIASDLMNVYPSDLLNNNFKMYSRNIETGNVHNKLGGKIYDYQDYYATIRLPLELFNVKTVTYEGAYMSNIDNFNWYYNNEGWKKVSEVKIKHYVESLGKTYIPV